MEQQNFGAAAAAAFGIKFVDPQTVLSQLEIKDRIRVADFGCGAGFFSLAFAQKIGNEGMVYALDILPERLETVNSQAKNLGIANITTQRANLEMEGGSKLPDQSVDWVVIKDMLYQNREKAKILAEAKRVVKNDGKILLIEWKTEDTSIGPDRNLRISKESLVSLAQENGLGVFKEVGAGDFHYGLILIK